MIRFSLLSFVVLVAVLATGCAGIPHYQPPPPGMPTSRVLVTGTRMPIVGALDWTSTVLLDRSTCKPQAFIEPTKLNQTSEIRFESGTPILLSLGFSGIRRSTPIGATPIYSCQDSLYFTPVFGTVYRVKLDESFLAIYICRATIQEAREDSMIWKNSEVVHTCQRQ